MLNIKKQVLKYLKSIIYLVKNFGGYLHIIPSSQKFGGYIPSIPLPGFTPLLQILPTLNVSDKYKRTLHTIDQFVFQILVQSTSHYCI